MLFRREKLVSPASRITQGNRPPAKTPALCPEAGNHPARNRKYRWLIWIFPVVGLLSLVWFLIRVVPKPSRAAYPCQRVAAPLASGFLVWISGLIGSALAYRKARRFLRQSRYLFTGICIAVSVMAVWWSFNVAEEAGAEAAFTPAEPPNSPMGVAKGIHPGRVVWVHDPAATSWDGSTGNWWDDDSTDQNVVDYMMSKAIQTLTGQSSDPNAWDALFRHFNQTKGFGDIGFQQGEKIAIKINMNQNRGFTWSKGQGMPSPHVIYCLLDQLINAAGVPGSAITVYDASRYIGQPIYNMVRANPDPNFQSVRFVANGRIAPTRDTSNPLYTKAGTAYLPRCVTEAKYLINMALLRPHSLFGVTLCAKNHFGSTYFPSQGTWTPSPMHSYGLRGNAMGSYNCLVNLNGHRHLGGKTMLCMIDGLYPARNQENNVIKWASFGDDWCSSIFASQDPVAIDSVGLDFMRSEPRCADVVGNPDNYLHEAAQADNPPSGTVYDPERDGTPLASLGVHEHWNNPVDKKYSRNLGTGEGIELVVPSLTTADGPIENVATGKRYDYFRHAIMQADPGDHIVARRRIYHDSVNFEGKSITLSSTNPYDPSVVAATVLKGGSSHVVTFAGGEDADCVLAGFTITGAETAVYCSGASPTIANCRITGNEAAAIELRNGSNPTIANCEIAFNAGTGIEMWAKQSGRFVTYNRPTITNCTITGNLQYGIFGGIATITNSIIWSNSPPQIEGTHAQTLVTYSDVQDGWPGAGNIDADPHFADPENGDYHLKSEAGRWDTNGRTWIQDDVTSLCIDAGSPDSDWTAELWPNGKRTNMGAYGAIPQASMSLSNAGNSADLNTDDAVSFLDFADFAGSWSTEQVLLPEDLNRDGCVDTRDLAIFTEQWLWEQ